MFQVTNVKAEFAQSRLSIFKADTHHVLSDVRDSDAMWEKETSN